MQLKIHAFGLGLVLLAFTTAALAADDRAKISADKGREALAVLKSTAPEGEKALACKRLAVYGRTEAVPALAALLSSIMRHAAFITSWLERITCGRP